LIAFACLDKDNNTLEFTLIKDMTVHDADNPWWASFLKDDEKIDVDLIEVSQQHDRCCAETLACVQGSKYLDVSLLKKVKAEKERKKLAEMESKAAQSAGQSQGESASATSTAKQ
jgi:hypothetical protein